MPSISRNSSLEGLISITNFLKGIVSYLLSILIWRATLVFIALSNAVRLKSIISTSLACETYSDKFSGTTTSSPKKFWRINVLIFIGSYKSSGLNNGVRIPFIPRICWTVSSSSLSSSFSDLDFVKCKYSIPSLPLLSLHS